MRDDMPATITIGDKYGPAMTITTQVEADSYLERCVEHTLRCHGGTREDAEKIERDNLGYFAGYYDHATRARVERLFRCQHPIFGAIAEVGPPTADEAYARGLAMGRSTVSTTRGIEGDDAMDLITQLVQKGVGIRLTEIHAERERLERFLNNPARHTPRVHWTRRPENRTKVLNARLRAALTRRTRRGRLL